LLHVHYFASFLRLQSETLHVSKRLQRKETKQKEVSEWNVNERLFCSFASLLPFIAPSLLCFLFGFSAIWLCRAKKPNRFFTFRLFGFAEPNRFFALPSLTSAKERSVCEDTKQFTLQRSGDSL
jgi:hypothetical protein